MGEKKSLRSILGDSNKKSRGVMLVMGQVKHSPNYTHNYTQNH
ncbi:hypothetical protein VAE151_560811 [Vibrio aestuarianus]|nr:hypothetical protein VAE308_1051454 [Vibrio aestuarianus]CAH8210771.1 hypothetical protein VAE032_271451 [Vibrio aestuarianus]CAH8211542.1 hypothetical protein VAE115_321454 [Vibrio aestuarianus]CAH8222725.1 hypothetical protein VAE151_560811 [Vibrio aestuarianus]